MSAILFWVLVVMVSAVGFRGVYLLDLWLRCSCLLGCVACVEVVFGLIVLL